MALRLREIEVGDVHSELLIDNLTRGHIVAYAGAVGDYAAEHSDEVYARSVGLPSVFGHAMFTVGMTTRMLTTWAGAGRLMSLNVRFPAIRAWPGDSLTATATVTAVHPDLLCIDLDFVTTNHEGANVLKGTARVRVDGF